MSGHPWREEALQFRCDGDELLGILSRPEAAGSSAPLARTALLIIVGGPQYRVGSHRQFALLARHLAAQGHAVLRFDYRGMGDGEGQARDFEGVTADIGAAIDALLAATPGVERVALWGLCDAASAALLYCAERRDPRIAGLALLNPWARSAASLARTQVKHYYLQRVMQPSFWLKLLSGRVAGAALRGLLANLRLARGGGSATAATAGNAAQRPFQERMLEGWRAFGGPRLLLLSDRDHTAKEFLEYCAASPAWTVALTHERLERCEIVDADHTCSSAAARGQVEAATARWLAGLS